MGRVVVIDGPAGSGKSTTAMALARRLGFRYLDTGAMYRAVTLKIISNSKSNSLDDKNIENILATTKITLRNEASGLRIFLDNDDVTDKIRSKEVDAMVSQVSAIPVVRVFMQKQQRAFGEKYNVVADGRDLGTYVFPDADVKIFMVADLKTRAKRRCLQLGAPVDAIQSLEENLRRRDEIDSSRAHSPLKKAPDAIEIDTTNMTIDEQVDKIFRICLAKFK